MDEEEINTTEILLFTTTGSEVHITVKGGRDYRNGNKETAPGRRAVPRRFLTLVKGFICLAMRATSASFSLLAFFRLLRAVRAVLLFFLLLLLFFAHVGFSLRDA